MAALNPNSTNYYYYALGDDGVHHFFSSYSEHQAFPEQLMAMEKRLELLSPAGDWERLEMALAYGADAVYLAGDTFGMWAFAGNFSQEDLPRAAAPVPGEGGGPPRHLQHHAPQPGGGRPPPPGWNCWRRAGSLR